MVGKDKKTIVHPKVAARVVCVFPKQDVQIADTKVTRLDSQVLIPWLQTYELGQGIDALTGHSRISPFKNVKKLPIAHESDLRSDLEIRIVHGLHERSNLLRFQGQGTINTHSPVTLGGSFLGERAESVSDVSFMIEHNAYGEYHFETLNTDDLKLTPEAQGLLKTPTQFRQRYGDYFILGYQRRYAFNALVQFT
jgi:hypothetical protein